MAALCSIGSGLNSGRNHVSELLPPVKSGAPFSAAEHVDSCAKPSDDTSTIFRNPSRLFWLRVIPSWAKPMAKLSETTCTSSAELGCCRQPEIEERNAHPHLSQVWKNRMLGVISLPLLAALLIYRFLFSPLKSIVFGSSARCRFIPSCSAYAYDAIRIHGPFAGVWLAAKRLIRCQPWGGAGHDPVPHPIEHSTQFSTSR